MTNIRYSIKLKKSFIFAVGGLFVIMLNGCSTVPRAKENFTAYNIKGVSYYPLISLCSQRGIKWDYDTFDKILTLTGDSHKISLMAGENLVIVDGKGRYLKHKVYLYKGTMAAPAEFKKEVLDELFAEPALPPANASIPSVAADIKTNIKTVVVDAGHGGEDPGAIGRSGLKEKNINLDIVNRLAKLLKEDGIKVVLTRSADYYVSLEKRVEIANRAKADLFISIHTNASRERDLSGFEVYYVSPEVSDLIRAKFSASNEVLNIDSSCYDNLTANLKTILWDMIYKFSRAESVRLAQSICAVVNTDLSVKVLGVKNAAFHVLRGANMPAVLVETGFVSNQKEELKLKNNFYRQQIADAIERGIKKYSQSRVIAEALSQ